MYQLFIALNKKQLYLRDHFTKQAVQFYLHIL